MTGNRVVHLKWLESEIGESSFQIRRLCSYRTHASAAGIICDGNGRM